MNENDFGPRLYQFMKRKNITVSELANLVGVSQSTVSLWISGKRTPRGKYLTKIAESLGIDELSLYFSREMIVEYHLSSYFKKFNLDINDYENLIFLDEQLSFSFYNIVEKYRKKTV